MFSNRPANEPATPESRHAPQRPFSFDDLAEVSRRVVGRSSPSVVLVEVRREGDSPETGDDLERLLGSGRDPSAPPTQGSGVVVDAAGYILTNAHVVRGADQITVHLPGDEQAEAKLIGIDAASDLALLRVERQNLTAAEWGDSEALAIGDFIWAIGSPYGLERSVSFGIVSAKQRRLPSLPGVGLLQTDAAINPGSSGGPLVDREGRVVGISTAILGRNHHGVGFAVPASVARIAVVNLLADGSARTEAQQGR
jgi:S1-C subfamily serine protease